MKELIIINGPNLNMLGEREPGKYGVLSLDDIISHTEENLDAQKVKLIWWQSNSESKIIDKIQEVSKLKYDALVINPAAFSHTSIAILDALKILNIPIIEVHLTNVYDREHFRHTLLTAKAASIIMSGLGKDAYLYAIKTQL
jgi:3-dehydroquinate dehydratase II